MLKLINKQELYNDNIGYVAEVDTSEVTSFEKAKTFIADVASVTRGKLYSNNPNKVFDKISREAQGNKPGRPFEYATVQAGRYHSREYLNDNNIIDYSYHFRCKRLNDYTNLRCIKTDALSEYTFFIPENFKVITGRVPKFVYDHIRTHTKISWMSETVRVKNINKVEFWSPDVNDSLFEYLNKQSLNLYDICKSKGYPDEICARELSSRRYVNFIAAAPMFPHTWENFVLERTRKAVQLPTRELAKAIKIILNK